MSDIRSFLWVREFAPFIVEKIAHPLSAKWVLACIYALMGGGCQSVYKAYIKISFLILRVLCLFFLCRRRNRIDEVSWAIFLRVTLLLLSSFSNHEGHSDNWPKPNHSIIPQIVKWMQKSCDAPYIIRAVVHRVEAMYVSVIDYQWYCTQRNGFQWYSHSQHLIMITRISYEIILTISIPKFINIALF